MGGAGGVIHFRQRFKIRFRKPRQGNRRVQTAVRGDAAYDRFRGGDHLRPAGADKRHNTISS